MKIPSEGVLFRIFLSCLLIGSGGFFIHNALHNPDVPYLLPLQGAQWIDCDLPIQLTSYSPSTVSGFYRRSLTVDAVPARASITFAAMKDAYAVIDGVPLIGLRSDMRSWKTARQVDIPSLTPGKHLLEFAVFDTNGPPLLAVSCDGIDCSAGSQWESRCETIDWHGVRLADAPRLADVSNQFPSAAEACLKQLPILVAVFVAAFLFLRSPYKAWFTPSRVRWLLMLFLTALGVNNIVRLPAGFGYETSAHLDYARYILDHLHLPLGTDGWQMFQPPLYYLYTAPIYGLLRCWFDDPTCIRLLRAAAIPCMLALVELSYRAVRRLYAERKDLQIAGMVVAALLPMNLYIGQFIGNEPLSAALTAGAIAYGMKISAGKKAVSKVEFLVAGFLVGAALLTKTSAIVLCAPFLWLMIHVVASRTTTRRASHAVIDGAAFAAGVAVPALWFYARNWVLLGKPFIGGWEPRGSIAWWQEPGYRVLGHFLSFGESLRHPIYSGLTGFWDALYSTFWLDGFLTGMTDFSTRPPWNYSPMISLAWFSLLPALALVVGTARAIFLKRADPRLRFAAACVVSYLLALLWLYLRLGNYTAVKASYLCGLAPAFCVLGAEGFSQLGRHRWAKDVVWAGLACWAVSACASFFVR